MLGSYFRRKFITSFSIKLGVTARWI